MNEMSGVVSSKESKKIKEFKNKINENIAYHKQEYAPILEVETSAMKLSRPPLEEPSNMVKQVVGMKAEKLLNDKYALESCEVNEDENKVKPVGSDSLYSPYGLLENDLNNTEVGTVKKLDNEKCTIYRDVLVNLDKSGTIENVENSWNKTFKDNCGNW